MIYAHHTCTAAFRVGLFALYPGLGTNKAYWRLMGALIFPQHVDDESGRVILSQSYLASLDEKLPQYQQRNYRARVLLEDFKRDVLPDFAYSDWSYVHRKARMVTNTGLSTDVDTLVSAMLADPQFCNAQLVFLDDGCKSDNEAARTALKMEQERYAKHDPNPSYVQHIIDYQNGLDTRLYTRAINKHWSRAVLCVCPSLTSGVGGAATAGMSYRDRKTLGVLCAVKAQTHPYLRAVKKSTRLYGIGSSLQTLRKDVRRALTTDWVEYDLRSAQFAIAAKVWDVPEMRGALENAMRNGLSLWGKISLEVGIHPGIYNRESKYKNAFKKATYALAFGSGEARVKRIVREETGDSDLADRFRAHPLIDALYKGRERRISRILRDRGLTTIYGQRIDIKPGSLKQMREQVRTALAQEAQAYEVALIEPIYNLAIQNENDPNKKEHAKFQVPLYLFDGVLIRYGNRSRAGKLEKAIKKAVQDKADELGIYTQLDGHFDK